MSYFVYILYSETVGVYYKGFTTDPEKRLDEHNTGQSRYTSGKGPWKMVYLEALKTKTEALKREKALKRYNTDYLKILITSATNLLRSETVE